MFNACNLFLILSMSLLSVENLSVAYTDKSIIKNCNFQLKSNEIIVVLGASGDGKTTLLKAIAGLLPFETGVVKFKDVAILDASNKLVPGHERIKLVNQDFALDEFHTVEENLRLRLLPYDTDYQQMRIKSLLRLTKLTPYRHVKATALSGGQQQRLAIARALADEPELVLLDEPFNQLDFQTKNLIATHVKAYLKKNKIGAIMVTHNGVEAMEWADKIIYFEAGEIQRIDSPTDFYNSPRTVKEARFFGTINKVKIRNKLYYFRPSDFSLKKDKHYTVKLDLVFKSLTQMGWYGMYTFKAGKQKVVLYAKDDISTLSKIFFHPLPIVD